MSAALLTAEDLAARFGAPVSTVYKWNKEKGWPHVRVGKRIRWTEDQFAEILRRQSVTPKKGDALPGQTARSAARGQR